MSDRNHDVPVGDRDEESELLPGETPLQRIRRMAEQPAPAQESEPASVYSEAARARARRDREEGSSEDRVNKIMRGEPRQPGEEG